MMELKIPLIVMCYFNQPNQETYERLEDILLSFRDDGYDFIRLDKK